MLLKAAATTGQVLLSECTRQGFSTAGGLQDFIGTNGTEQALKFVRQARGMTQAINLQLAVLIDAA